MIPKAKTLNWLSAPPVKVLNKPKKAPLVFKERLYDVPVNPWKSGTWTPKTINKEDKIT